MLSRYFTRSQEPLKGKIFLKWPWLLLLVTRITAAQERDAELTCRYGNSYVPEKLFNHLIAWDCFEYMGYNDGIITHVCQTAEGYKVPCIKSNGVYTDFNLMAKKQRMMSKETKKEEELGLCLNRQTDCEHQSSDVDFLNRIWQPSTNPNVCNTEPRNKFHISMLSISFMLGVPATILLTYFSWSESSAFMSLHRNLVATLTFRSLMTLLIQTEIILPYSTGSNLVNSSGVPALATFETFCLNLAIGFWLLMTLFVWKSAQNEYKITPKIKVFNIIIIAISFLFTLIWIIVMACTKEDISWMEERSWDQWINDPIRIIFLLVQILLIAVVIKQVVTSKEKIAMGEGRMSRRIRREALYIFLLSPLFLLQFSMNAGTPTSNDCEEAFFFTLYFIDGLQGAIVCIFFCYIDAEVTSLLANMFGLGKPKLIPTKTISTLDSLRDKRNSDAANDVVYSTVVHPDQYERTINLYKKLNVTPKKSVTTLDGEAYLTCNPEYTRRLSTLSEYYDAVSYTEFNDTIGADANPREDTTNEMYQKRSVLPLNSRDITPIHSSRYSSINKSLSSTSSTSSSDSSPKLEEVKLNVPVVTVSSSDKPGSKDWIVDTSDSFPIVKSKFEVRKTSSSSTSDESFKHYPLATPVSLKNDGQKVNGLHVDVLLHRQSTQAVKGSSSEEALNIDHYPVEPSPYFPQKKENFIKGEPRSKKLLQKPSETSASDSEPERPKRKKPFTKKSEKRTRKTSTNAELKHKELEAKVQINTNVVVTNQKKEQTQALTERDDSPSSDSERDEPTLLSTDSAKSEISEGKTKSRNKELLRQRGMSSDLEYMSEDLSDLEIRRKSPERVKESVDENIPYVINVEETLKNNLKVEEDEELIGNRSSSSISTKKKGSSLSEESSDEPNGMYNKTSHQHPELEETSLDSTTNFPVIRLIEDMPAEKLERAVPIFIELSDVDILVADGDVEYKRIKPPEKGIATVVADLTPEKLPTPDKKMQMESLSLQRKPLSQAQTLPEIYDDLKIPAQRPKSLLDDRKNEFSKMFSKHRNKLLSSKSENDILEFERKNKGKQISTNIEALVSPTSSFERFTEGSLPKYAKFENLNQNENEIMILKKLPCLDPSEEDSTDTLSVSSDFSGGSQSSVKTGPHPHSKMVLQHKEGHEWDPQEVYFTESSLI